MKKTAEKRNVGQSSKGIKTGVYVAVLIVIAVCAVFLFLLLRTPKLKLPYMTAHYIAVLDLENSTFLYEKEGDQEHAPASVTKLMTLFLVMDEIKSGRLHWDDTYMVTPEEAYTEGSKYGVKPGDRLTVRQLVAGAAMPSGCDCVQCLVKLCAADEAEFVARMNEKAQQLGLRNTRFENSTGIDAREHYMSAKDIARLSKALIEEHPEILEFTSASELQDGEHTFYNTNRLLGRDPRVKGLKTGTTLVGGYNLATYVEDEAGSYIIVVLSSNSASTLYSETSAIIKALYEET